MAMPAGRPSDYESKHAAFAVSYLTMFEELGDAVPTIEGLCDELKISKQTAYTWSETYPEFLDALERIKAKQGRLLQAKGLQGKFAPVITKLMLSANHGMREKSDITTDDKPIGSADKAIAQIDSSMKS